MTDSQPARGCDLNALTVTNLRNRMEASAKAANYHQRGFVDVPIQELERLLDMVQPSPIPAGDEAVSAEMDKLSRAYWDGKPSRIVKPVGRGGVVTDEIKSLRLAMEEYGSDAWATISDGDRCRSPGNHAEAIRQLLEPVAGGGGEVDDAMVERALTASYRDIDWNYGTIEDVLQACQPHVVRGWVRAMIVAALQVKP